MRHESHLEDRAHERPETSIRIKTIGINRYFNGLLTNLGASIENVLLNFKPENSGISAVTVASYRHLGWDPKGQNLWDDLFENRLNECTDKYYAGRKVLNTIRNVVIPDSAPPLTDHLKALAKEYDTYLIELAQVQENLLAMNQDALKDGLPNEPELPPEVAHSLFANYKSLEDRVRTLEENFAFWEKAIRISKKPDGAPLEIYANIPLIVTGAVDARDFVVRTESAGAVMSIGQQSGGEAYIIIYGDDGKHRELFYNRKDGTYRRQSLIKNGELSD